MNAQCLTNIPIPNLSNQTFQQWNAEDECKLYYGNNSVYCQVRYCLKLFLI